MELALAWQSRLTFGQYYLVNFFEEVGVDSLKSVKEIVERLGIHLHSFYRWNSRLRDLGLTHFPTKERTTKRSLSDRMVVADRSVEELLTDRSVVAERSQSLNPDSEEVSPLRSLNEDELCAKRSLSTNESVANLRSQTSNSDSEEVSPLRSLSEEELSAKRSLSTNESVANLRSVNSNADTEGDSPLRSPCPNEFSTGSKTDTSSSRSNNSLTTSRNPNNCIDKEGLKDVVKQLREARISPDDVSWTFTKFPLKTLLNAIEYVKQQKWSSKPAGLFVRACREGLAPMPDPGPLPGMLADVRPIDPDSEKRIDKAIEQGIFRDKFFSSNGNCLKVVLQNFEQMPWWEAIEVMDMRRDAVINTLARIT